MKARLLLVVAPVAALSLSCGTDHSDTACAGYLGCSADQRIGPPESEPVAMVTNPPGVVPLGLNAIAPSSGCGKALALDTPPTVPGTPQGYKQYTVMGTGVTLAGTIPAKAGPRTFWVRAPADYDATHPYRVVYVGQACDGYEVANTATLPLYDESLGGTEQAIYVALDIPRDMANLDCYDTRDGPASQEWEAFDLFHSVVEATYCVDNDRIYVAGYDSGGSLANMWGCYFASDGTEPARQFATRYHIRAQAAVAGGEPPNQPACNGPVAALWIHDQADQTDAIAGNLDALARVGRMNGCVTTPGSLLNQPWHPEAPLLGDVCQRFPGCPEDYPVVFCTTSGLGHSDQRQRATAAIKTFFDELDVTPVLTLH